MQRLGIELMHTHLSRAHAFGALLRVWYGGPALVATAHSQHMQLHWMLNDLVIAASEPTAEFHRRYNRVSRRRLAIIPNFVNLGQFSPATPERRRAAREALELADEAFVIGSVGIERKTPTDLIRTLAALDRRGVTANLVLIGAAEESEVERLLALARALGVAGRFRLLSWRNDVPDLLPAFDVYAQTARRGQMPTNVLEAMATGLPVFGT
jgi:glycosyltransferase involved in cell wall biosynthesis